MTTYIVNSHTNYGTLIHVVNAETEEEALRLALADGAWEGCEAESVDVNTPGVVGSF